MEAILSQLLQPDNEVIKAATEQLRTAFKQPGVIEELCNVLRQVFKYFETKLTLKFLCSSSQQVQIRQYAAVLLRKKFSKSGSWFKLPAQDRDRLKAGSLNCLVTEPEKLVRSAVAQLVGTLSKHELGSRGGGWQELFMFIMARLDSQNNQVNYIFDARNYSLILSPGENSWLHVVECDR